MDLNGLENRVLNNIQIQSLKLYILNCLEFKIIKKFWKFGQIIYILIKNVDFDEIGFM